MRYSAISASPFRQARASPSSDPMAPARRRCSICSPASTARPAGGEPGSGSAPVVPAAAPGTGWRTQPLARAAESLCRLARMEQRLAELERRYGGGRRCADDALEAYGQLQAEFERRGGYEYETRIKRVLSGLGFSPAEYDVPLPQLSGGEKTRAALGRLLLEEPDLLISTSQPIIWIFRRSNGWRSTWPHSRAPCSPSATIVTSSINFAASRFGKLNTESCKPIAATTAPTAGSAPANVKPCATIIIGSSNSSARKKNSSAATWAAAAPPRPRDA